MHFDHVLTIIGFIAWLGLIRADFTIGQLQAATYPAPPKSAGRPVIGQNISMFVPSPIENYTLTVTGNLNDTTYYTSSVPLFTIDGIRNRHQRGEIPIGTVIQPVAVQPYRGVHYYGLAQGTDASSGTTSGTDAGKKKDLNTPSILWIDGMFVTITGQK